MSALQVAMVLGLVVAKEHGARTGTRAGNWGETVRVCARRTCRARQVVEVVLGGHGKHRIGAHGRIEIPLTLPIVLPHRKQRTPGRPPGSIRLH